MEVELYCNKFWHLTHSYFVSFFKKLARQRATLAMVKCADHQEKGRAADILITDAMRSKEGCYKNGENRNPKVTKYSKKTSMGKQSNEKNKRN